MKKTVKTTAKETAKSTAVKTENAVKEAAVKETGKSEPTKKATAKKAVAKKAAIKETVYLQYLGKEINHQDIIKQIKEVWTKQLKKKVGDIKSITIYFKPEENAAYYVVNDDVTGSIAL